MTVSIVNDSASAQTIRGVAKTERWVCDVYRGTVDALVAAGLISLPQLQQQKGRRVGYSVFLPDGSPCPPTQRAWRVPGYKTIFQVDDGTLIVEVTVSKEIQARRRTAEKAARHEREQLRIHEVLVECGQQYRNWELEHGYNDEYEHWEGTKEQLQGEGIGVGTAFPGEPGVRGDMYCKCPLGFDVRVFLPGSYDPGKHAARIYTAQSWYVRRAEEPKQYAEYAPGVMREVWTPTSWEWRDIFIGSAQALVTAGLVPSAHLFPAQPGTNKQQASYLNDWTKANNSRQNRSATRICKLGKGDQYRLELGLSEAEEKRRAEARDQYKKEMSDRAKVLAAERKLLRQGAEPEKSEEEFRAGRAKQFDLFSDLLWRAVFVKGEGALSFDIPKDSELWEDLAEAFQTIRDAVQEADIVRDIKQSVVAQARLKLVAARNDKGLQSMLRGAAELRLVRSADDGARE